MAVVVVEVVVVIGGVCVEDVGPTEWSTRKDMLIGLGLDGVWVVVVVEKGGGVDGAAAKIVDWAPCGVVMWEVLVNIDIVVQFIEVIGGEGWWGRVWAMGWRWRWWDG